MQVRFAEDRDLAAVARFNDRLRKAGRSEEMLLDPALPGEALYRPDGFPIFRRLIIAEDGKEVRAAMLLCHHNIFIDGIKHDFCWTKLPLSEGIIDPRYALAIIQLIKKTLDNQPFLMGVGAGTSDSDGYRFFSRLKWRYQDIPFFFFPVNLTRVLNGLEYLKKRRLLFAGAKLAAWTGFGFTVGALLSARRKLAGRGSNYETSLESSFSDWASDLFFQALGDYRVAVRSDATSLNILYPPDDHRYIRLRVYRKPGMEDAGWLVVAVKEMKNNHYFGNLRVGTLVDGFGRIGDIDGLIAVGIDKLVEMGVDLIVANFSHTAWKEACHRCGMIGGPSNFNLFVSPGGGNLLEAPYPLHDIHIARGHSDGMDNLI